MTTAEHDTLREELERTHNTNRVTLRVAEQRSKQRQADARRSRIAVERARRALRRAGLLKPA